MDSGISATVTPRKRNVLLIVGIGIALLVAVLVVSLVIRSQTSKNSGHQVVVQITPNGFLPSTLVVTRGTVIVWQNTDTAPHVVASNPYPKDTDVPGLHSKAIVPNGTYSFTPSASGTISYHDDLMPTHNATIEVR